MNETKLENGNYFKGIAALANVTGSEVMMMAKDKRTLDKAWGLMFGKGRKTLSSKNKRAIIFSTSALK